MRFFCCRFLMMEQHWLWISLIINCDINLVKAETKITKRTSFSLQPFLNFWSVHNVMTYPIEMLRKTWIHHILLQVIEFCSSVLAGISLNGKATFVFLSVKAQDSWTEAVVLVPMVAGSIPGHKPLMHVFLTFCCLCLQSLFSCPIKTVIKV